MCCSGSITVAGNDPLLSDFYGVYETKEVLDTERLIVYKMDSSSMPKVTTATIRTNGYYPIMFDGKSTENSTIRIQPARSNYGLYVRPEYGCPTELKHWEYSLGSNDPNKPADITVICTRR